MKDEHFKQNRNEITKTQLLDTTIRLIDDKGGASSVSLREVARMTGCSAPNLYNYFESLDDLLNHALRRICEDYGRKLEEKTAGVETPEELLLCAFQVYIEYALDHPGRINFFHFESLQFQVSKESNESAEGVGNEMARLMGLGNGQKYPDQRMEEITGILHRYLLGELSEVVTGRKIIVNKEEMASRLIVTCKKLYGILVRHYS